MPLWAASGPGPSREGLEQDRTGTPTARLAVIRLPPPHPPTRTPPTCTPPHCVHALHCLPAPTPPRQALQGGITGSGSLRFLPLLPPCPHLALTCSLILQSESGHGGALSERATFSRSHVSKTSSQHHEPEAASVASACVGLTHHSRRDPSWGAALPPLPSPPGCLPARLSPQPLTSPCPSSM